MGKVQMIVAAVLFAAGPAHGDETRELNDWLGAVAARLGEDNAGDFLSAFDRKMPGRETLARNVAAIMQAAEVSSSVRIAGIAGTPDRREVKVDWFLSLRPKLPGGATEQRRDTVTLRLSRRKKGWLIVAMEPPGLFRPPEIR